MREYIALFIDVIAEVMILAIFFRVIMSWIKPRGGGGKIYLFLHEITEPVMGFFRKVTPRIGMIDISPIIAIFAIEFARFLIIELIV
jgi:YggT family protein